jgi:hypothetical protein
MAATAIVAALTRSLDFIVGFLVIIDHVLAVNLVGPQSPRQSRNQNQSHGDNQVNRYS